MWRVDANILNKKSRTANKGGPPACGLGEVLTTSHSKNMSFYAPFTKELVSAVMNLRVLQNGGNFLTS